MRRRSAGRRRLGRRRLLGWGRVALTFQVAATRSHGRPVRLRGARLQVLGKEGSWHRGGAPESPETLPGRRGAYDARRGFDCPEPCLALVASKTCPDLPRRVENLGNQGARLSQAQWVVSQNRSSSTCPTSSYFFSGADCRVQKWHFPVSYGPHDPGLGLSFAPSHLPPWSRASRATV